MVDGVSERQTAIVLDGRGARQFTLDGGTRVAGWLDVDPCRIA